MFLAKKILALVLLPPLAPLLLILAGLLLLGRHPRLGRTLAWGGLTLAVLLSTPWSVHKILVPLEAMPVATSRELATAQAIVILGGGKTGHAPEYGGETVNRLSLERCRYGARLAKQTGLPVLVTGGAPTGADGTSEAALMRDALEKDFGVKVRWVEDKALDTGDNARMSAALLKTAGVRRIALVSHAAHLQRALVEFRQAGLDVVPAPTGFLGGRQDSEAAGELAVYVPGPAAAYAGWYASHEWLGYLAWKLRTLLGS